MAFDSAAEKLLLACIRCALDAVPPGEVLKLAAGIDDWPHFLELASDHCLEPLAADYLLRSGAVIPDDVSATLEKSLTGNARRVFLLSNELLRLKRLLDDAGIPAIALKGPVVAHTCYSEPAQRMIGDLDLLIRQSDIDTAIQALERAGYRDDGDAHLRACRKAFRRWNNELAFHHSANRFSVDLHWDFSEAGFAGKLDPNKLTRRAQPATVSGVALPALSPRDNLIFLCAHAAKHEWSSLHWLVDICGLIRQHPGVLNGEPVRDADAMTWAGLLLADFVLDGHVPELAEYCRSAPSSARVLASGILSRVGSGGYALEKLPQRLRFLYAISGGILPAMRSLLAQIAIPREADWVSMKIESPRLFFLYYPWRIARLCRKWLPFNSKASESA